MKVKKGQKQKKKGKLPAEKFPLAIHNRIVDDCHIEKK